MNLTGWRWLLLGPGGFSGAEDLCRGGKEWGRGCTWEPARRERSEAPGRNQVKLETFQKVRIDLKIFYLKVSFTKYLLAEASSWPITSSRWWPTKATWKNMKIHHNYQIWIISYDIYIYTIHIIYEYISWKYVKVCKKCNHCHLHQQLLIENLLHDQRRVVHVRGSCHEDRRYIIVASRKDES